MTRVALAAAVLAMVVGTGTGTAPASARPPVERDAIVSVIVVLDAQAGVPAVRGRHQAAVERALRATAADGQRGILALLRERQRQGLVSAITPLWIVNGISVTATPSVIRELAGRTDVREVDPERTIQAPPQIAAPFSSRPAPGAASPVAVEPNVARVNAPALWDMGFRGQGTVVASMDTGVDASHPDLAGRWRGGTDSWYDPYGEHPSVPTDVNGHGTATTGVMVGGDAGGTAIGVAPDARWVAVKMFNDRGTATSTAIHLAYQWLLDPDGNPATNDAPDVVNNSWTLSSGGCSADFRPDLANLRAAGILPVFAAGKYGPTPRTLISPAHKPQGLPAGCTHNARLGRPSSSPGPPPGGQG